MAERDNNSIAQEDDPVEQELDIQLTHVPADNILLLQYPLRPRYRPYSDMGHLEQAKFKGLAHLADLQLVFCHPLAADDPHFDPSTRRTTGVVSQTLKSTRTDLQTHYCLGFV